MRIHMIAIGGAVMHALALELQRLGHGVSGSDDQIFDPARTRLLQAGLLPPTDGWDPQRVTSELDLVLLGMHARPDNPELQKALSLGLPVMSFPEFLGRKWQGVPQVVVAGSHGKTTVTALLMHTLRQAGWTFDYLVGSSVLGFERNVRLSEAPALAIVEGDEYLSSPLDERPKFMHYNPAHFILTGIAWDHANVFPTEDSYVDAFRRRLVSLPAGATVYYDHEDSALRALIAEFQGVDWEAVGYKALPHDSSKEEPHFLTESGERIPVHLFGHHNMKNMAAVRAVCHRLGLSEASIYQAFATFEGAAGRLEKIWERAPDVAYRDFAHAPSKVRATVAAVRHRYPHHWLIAALELHTYSSLSRTYLPLYAHTLEQADKAFVFYDSHALELKKLPPLPPAEVARAFAGNVEVVVHDAEALASAILESLRSPFVLLLMSSGSWQGLAWQSLLNDKR